MNEPAVTPPSDAEPSQATLVPALHRAFLILDFITDSISAPSAAQIAKSLDLPRSSVHGILQTLVHKGVLRKDENNLFHLGSYLLYWSGKFEKQQDVIAIFHELIVKDARLAAHAVTLSTLDEQKGEVVFLACHESLAPLGFAFRSGVRVPATFAATGKAMMSLMSDERIRQMYPQGLPKPLTANGVDSFGALFAELQVVRQTRISLDNGQLRIGMYCLGTFIRNAQGKASYGIAVSFLQHEYEQKKDEISEAIITLAMNIEQRLSYL